MKTVYIDVDLDGHHYVREIVPDGIDDLSSVYSKDFLDHCVVTSENVTENMLYNPETKEFYEASMDSALDDTVEYLYVYNVVAESINKI